MAQAIKAPKFSPQEAASLYAKAHAAGMAAGEAAIPTPMHIVERENPFDDSSPIIKRYAPVMDGPCGFAQIKIRPGNSSFANWARKRNLGYQGYHGGYEISVRGFNQSYERKMAYARAFAAVLEEAGIQAYPQGRLD